MTADTEKQATLDRFLEEDHALVHLKPDFDGVVVPEHFTSQTSLTLKLSRLFRGAMAIEENRVVAELLFDGKYFTCFIPFDSVWGITSTSGKTRLWPNDAPKEILKAMESTVTQNALAEVPPEADDEAAVEQDKPRRAPSGRPQLRRVK